VADKDAIVRSYAEALFRVADAEGELDAVERRLFAFAELPAAQAYMESDAQVGKIAVRVD